MAESRLHQLSARGQSVWIDYLSRDLVESGELKRMMEEDAVVGVTSNPTIFQKAISQGDAYDEQLQGAARATRTIRRRSSSHLAVRDVERRAATCSRPVHERNAQDGYVSIEVDPTLAYDTRGDLRRGDPPARVDRPAEPLREDPGDEAGPAGDRGLHRAPAAASTSRSSSRSSATSEVDGGVPPRARAVRRGRRRPGEGALGRELLRLARRHRDRQAAGGDRLRRGARARGKLAIANARIAYQHYQQAFCGARWEALEAKGALPQRCLWASTSTKNPAYRDVLYVEELIGPHTVNTMPEETIKAFQDHGEVRGDTVARGPRRGARGCSSELRRRRRRLRRRRGDAREGGRAEVLRLVHGAARRRAAKRESRGR